MVKKLLCLCLLTLAACVKMDPKTGEALPRGEQRFKFEHVMERSEDLEEGMSKVQVLLLLGSPAEMSSHGEVWLYLPERTGFLIPALALRLKFQGDYLSEHGRVPIVLGETL
jgi:outer membrane protein assembly factor BamE (lipoprotein component of BamABCDE complex)